MQLVEHVEDEEDCFEAIDKREEFEFRLLVFLVIDLECWGIVRRLFLEFCADLSSGSPLLLNVVVLFEMIVCCFGICLRM